MSYILDALKRADAERERGVVPGLYARQVTTASGKTAAQGHRPLRLALAAAMLLGGMAAGLALWLVPNEAPREALPEPAVARTTERTPPLQPAATPVMPAPVAPAPVSLAPVAPMTSVAAIRAPAVVTAAAPARSTASPPLPASKASASRPAVAVPMLAELSEELRRQIPALTVTGAVYAESPGQRLLLVNNQVVNQGGQAAPEVNLEEIGPKSSIFSFRGTRFRLTH